MQPVASSPRILKTLGTWWGPQTLTQWKNEILASLVVCFAQIPESVAFAALAHVPPDVGLHAAWIVGLICALFGGRPGMINGSAGALASVTCNFVVAGSHRGIEALFVSVVCAGLLIMICAAFNIGRFLVLVPATVMIGFCNGLAIVIGNAQLSWFQDADGDWVQGKVLVATSVHCVVALLIMLFLPKLTKKMPASLIAIILGFVIELTVMRPAFNVRTITIGDKSEFARSRSVPRLFFLDNAYDLKNITNLQDVAFQSLTLALVAMLESLMTLEVMNDLTGTFGQPNRQVWALGVSNILAGLFGTMGGNSLIELSVMNVQAGGVLRASAVMVSLGVLAIVLFASPLLNLIPAGTLCGIMVVVVMDTAKWSSIPAMVASFLPESLFEDRDDVVADNSCQNRVKSWLRGLRIQKYDAFIITLVTVITAITNLAIAVFSGMFFASLKFAWEAQKPLEIIVKDSEEPPERTYTLKGNLFFASREKLATTLTPDADPAVVHIDFGKAVVYDFSVLHGLHPALKRYSELGTVVHIKNMRQATHLHNLLHFDCARADRTSGERQTISVLSSNGESTIPFLAGVLPQA